MNFLGNFLKIVFIITSLCLSGLYFYSNHFSDQHISSHDRTCDIKNLDVHRVILMNNLSHEHSQLHFAKQYATMSGDSSISLTPGAIVYCTTEEQVVETVKFAERCGYTLSVRSGGHSYTAESSCSSSKCIQIDVSLMNHLEFNGSTIVAGPGVLLHHLISESILHKLIIPHGVCKYVGLGGHLQSSATGILAPGYGSGMDHVQEFRIVLPNATVVTASINDSDSRIYRSVLGGGPGSWGIVTRYTINGIRDSDAPHSKLIIKKYKFTPDVAFTTWKHVIFIHQDQEATQKRDIGILFNIGHSASIIDFLPDIPLVGPVSKFVDVEKDQEVYVYVIMMWTGIDSGSLSDAMYDRYISPLNNMSQPLTGSLDLPMPLSLVSSVAATFNHEGYRYHIANVHTDTMWSDEWLRKIIDELDDRRKVDDSMFLFQFVSFGNQTQWYKNRYLNSLSMRDARAMSDDWFIFKNISRGDMIADRMRNFYQSNKRYWLYSDGSERRTWMTPQTIYKDSTNLSNPQIAQMYYPNQTQYKELCELRTEIDKKHLFANKGTVPRC